MTTKTAAVEIDEAQTIEVEGTGLPSLRAETPEKIAEVVQELTRIRDTSRDLVVPARGLRFTQDGDQPGLVLDLGGVAGETKFNPTRIAHQQIASRLNIPWKYYQRVKDEVPDLLGENVNAWLRRDDRKWLIRTDTDRVRAALSNSFRPLDGGDLFFSTFDVIKEAGAIISRIDVSETRTYIRALHPEYQERIEHIRQAPRGTTNVGGFDDDDWVVPGVVLSTSDVGLGSLKAELFIYRRICGNGMLGDDVFTRVHSGERLPEGLLSPNTIEVLNQGVWLQVQDAVRAAFNPDRFRELVKAFSRTTGEVIDEPVEAVEVIANKYGISDDRKSRILNELITGHEGSTVFGLVNAITAVGREEPNYDAGVALERVGGSIVRGEADRVLAPVLRR